MGITDLSLQMKIPRQLKQDLPQFCPGIEEKAYQEGWDLQLTLYWSFGSGFGVEQGQKKMPQRPSLPLGWLALQSFSDLGLFIHDPHLQFQYLSAGVPFIPQGV